MPFGGFENWDDCISKVGADKGQESASRICGAIKAQLEGKKNTEVLSKDEVHAVKLALAEAGIMRYSLEEIKEICPSCYEKMKKVNMKEILLPVSYFSDNKEIKLFDRIEGMEIFRSGTWNGDTYTNQDLDKMVENFRKLEGKHAVPIKIGHGEKQTFLEKEGLPAAGWIKSLQRFGDKLIANVEDVPSKIGDLIRKRAYKKVSAEIYPKYKDSEGNIFTNVLRAVALLGADIPAVEGLADVTALYTGEQSFKIYDQFTAKGGETMKSFGINVQAESFSDDFKEKLSGILKQTFGEGTSVEFQAEGDKAAEIADLKDKLAAATDPAEKDALKKKIDDMEAAMKPMSEENVALKAKNVELTNEVTSLRAKFQEESAGHKKYRDLVREKEIDAIVANGEKEGKILPAHRDTIRTLLLNASTDKVNKFKQKDGTEVDKSQFDLVKEYVESLPNMVNFAEISKDGKMVLIAKDRVTIKDKEYQVDDIELDTKVQAYAEQHKCSYEVAYMEVSKTEQVK